VRVQRVWMPDSGAESWTVLGDDYAPVEPVERWLAYLTVIERSPNTIKGYAHDLKDWFGFLQLHGLDWRSVQLEDVGGFLAWVRLAPSVRGGRVLVLPSVERYCTEASVNRKLSALAGFYQFHARHGVDVGELLIGLHPSGRPGGSWRPFLHHLAKHQPQRRRTVKLPAARRQPRILTARQVQAILDACQHLRDRLLFAVLFDSGMRIGEVLGLRHEDLAVAERQVTVTPTGQRQLGPGQGRHTPDDPGQRRAAAAVRRLPARRIRPAGLRLCIRQPLGSTLWAAAGLCDGL
jgi:integrase/recombinase XerD